LETGFFMGSVLIAYAGEVLLRQGYGMANLEHGVANSSQTKFRLGSVTKQFTAATILLLQEQGLLEINNLISTYLPNYPEGNQITVHQLLAHTAGIPNYTSFPDYVHKQRTPMTLDEIIAWFSDKPLEFTPGDSLRDGKAERYSYSNSGYTLLTKLIEVVSGQSYADYLQHHIFDVKQFPLRVIAPNQSTAADTNTRILVEWLEHIGLNFCTSATRSLQFQSLR
jgi:CubicO group peptidase (beta-lactamase class C family)